MYRDESTKSSRFKLEGLFYNCFFLSIVLFYLLNRLCFKGRDNIENQKERHIEETSIFLNITSKLIKAKDGQSNILIGTIDHSIGPVVTTYMA